MAIGNSLLAIAFVMTAVSTVGYALALLGRTSYVGLARRAYYGFVTLTALMSGYFLLQILDHNFALEYIYSYSSRDLPLGYLISTFWAGQVGSFLLWLLFLAIVGLFMLRHRTENQTAVMFFFLWINLFFLAILSSRSPFQLLPADFLAQFVGEVPPDGQGLNPLLQNFWMVIHPPVVFLGFSLLAAPFCYALAALARDNYRDWVKNALPWSAISSVCLGAGIFLGGYWAYETLGWGGYWAWDPVENTSLIPWLLNLALMHGLLIERRKGAWRRSNLLLASVSFLLVIYGTFLTRSGVLADFSVHSFTDLGITGYLVLFMVFFLLLSLVLFAVRIRSASGRRGVSDPYSVDFTLAVGVIFLLLLSLLTLVGTSAPLITRVFGEPASVSIDFYNRSGLPLAVVIGLLIGLSPFLMTGERVFFRLLRRLAPALLLSVAATVLAALLGVAQTIYLLMIFAASFAFFGNFLIIFQQSGKLGLRIGGFITHMGFGVLMIGVVVSSAFSQAEKINLHSGLEPMTSLGYQISYKGMQGDVNTKDNSVLLDVQKGETSFEADPRFFIARENQGLMRTPYIKRHLLYDLYLSPQNRQTTGDGDRLVLAKGEQDSISNLAVKFIDFDMDSHGQQEGMAVGAILEVSRDSITEVVIPYLAFTAGGKQLTEAELPGGDGSVILSDVQADAGMVSLQFAGIRGMDFVDLLVLEVSKKPLINLVWLGIILICVGSFIAYVRRRRLQFR